MLRAILEWILERPMAVVFVLIFVGQLLRGLMNARKTAEAEQPHAHGDLEEERRVREVQEQIRRRIAERRGERAPAAEQPPPLAPAESQPRPVARPETTQMPDVFEGPLGRMFEELQRRAHPQPAPPPPVVVESRVSAELERQRELEEQMQELRRARAQAERKAAEAARARESVAQEAATARESGRGRLAGDLGDAAALRRAFVLREVLGPPVGLR